MQNTVRCPACGASYTLDPARIPPGGARLSCPSCNHKWNIAGRGTTEKKSAGATCPRCGHHFEPSVTVNRRCVLVVDDQEFFRNFAVEALAPHYTVYVAKGSEEAVRSAEERSPDAIVLDLGLEHGPEEGKEVLRLLAGRFPVLILTGRTDLDLYGEGWQELADLGAQELVIKGLTMEDELRTKVAKLVGAE